jgi:hypothetical protein
MLPIDTLPPHKVLLAPPLDHPLVQTLLHLHARQLVIKTKYFSIGSLCRLDKSIPKTSTTYLANIVLSFHLRR